MYTRILPRLLPWCAAFLVVAAIAPRLSGADGAMVVLQGSVNPVPPGAGVGPDDPHRPYVKRATLEPAEAAGELRFEVALKMRNFTELKARIARGEIIPSAEMAIRYWPTLADYDAVSAWLAGQGFKITRKDDNHLAVFASGSVDAIQKAMKVSFARVSLEGEDYTSAVTAPSVPAAIAPALVSINGLQPHIRAHKHLVQRQNTPAGAVLPTNGANQTVVVSSTNGTGQPYTPAQIMQPYNATGLSVNGSGQTIAIVIDTLPNLNDVASFWNSCGVVGTATTNITGTQVVAGRLAAPSGEESLDAEWSSSIATGAKIRIYATLDLKSNDLDAGYQAVYADVIAHPEYGIHQMTMSYGIAETAEAAAEGSGQVFTDTQYFANLASAGVTLFASTGDSGNAPNGVSEEYPASDPHVTGIGGTSLTLTSSSNINTETGWNGSGGGTSIFFSRPVWQSGSGVPPGSTRCLPDVAAPADPNEGAYYNYNGTLGSVGGTSWSSPTWAGFCALINQARANAGLPPVGMLGPKIYSLIGTNNFHDITAGNNGYAAGVGYDMVTGIGSPNVGNLIATLTQPQPLVVPTLPMVTTLTPNQNATFTVASSGTASGNTYQWQRMPIGSGSWSNIAASGTYGGVISSSLAINGVTPAMSGDQFHCIINTGTAGQITTSPPSALVVDTRLKVTTLAGQAGNSGWEDGTGTNTLFAYPSLLAVGSSGNVYVPDNLDQTIRQITPAGMVTTPYGQPGVKGTLDGSGTNSQFHTPNAVAIDGSNNIYVADSVNDTIRKITAAGVVSTFAGSPMAAGTSNGVGTNALFNNPQGVAVDSAGNVYVADTNNNSIRKITASGSVSTFAGTSGTLGWQDGTGTAALFNGPVGVAVDGNGNVYVADYNNYVVRKITPAGVVTTPYGQPGVIGDLDGTGTNALFNSPVGITVDGANNIYVADSQFPLIGTISSTLTGNNILRRINPAGVVSTVAGTPDVTGTNDGTGPAAQFNSIQGVAVNSSGVVYIADTYNQLIRTGGFAPLITTIAGTQAVAAGQSVTFSVSAAGSGTSTYQWYFDGNPISNATNSSYTIPSASSGNAGSYTVMVTDAFGTSTSSIYTLTVNTLVPDLSYCMLAALGLLLLISTHAFLRGNRTGAELP